MSHRKDRRLLLKGRRHHHDSKDFISMLPERLALRILAYLEPLDLGRIAQTSRHWRRLTEQNKLLIQQKRDVGQLNRKISSSQSKHSSKPSHLGQVTSAAVDQEASHEPREWVSPSGHEHVNDNCLAISTRWVVSTRSKNVLGVWNPSTGECVRELIGHSGTIASIEFISDSCCLVSASEDSTLRVWEADTGRCLRVLQGHSDAVVRFAIHGNLIASASNDSTVRLWNLSSGRCLHVLRGHSSQVTNVCFDDDLIISSAANEIKVWQASTGFCTRTICCLRGSIAHLGFAGSVVFGLPVTATRGFFWDVNTGVELNSIKLEGGSRFVFLRSNHLLVGAANGTVQLYNVQTGRLLVRFNDTQHLTPLQLKLRNLLPCCAGSLAHILCDEKPIRDSHRNIDLRKCRLMSFKSDRKKLIVPVQSNAVIDTLYIYSVGESEDEELSSETEWEIRNASYSDSEED